MKKLPGIVLIGLIAVACGGRRGAPYVPAHIGESMGKAIAARKELNKEEIKSMAHPEGVHASFSGNYDEVFNDSNYIQYESAERLGILPMYTLSDVYNTRRPLVKIESGENYELDNLTHSMPFLVPEAASLLDEIGKRFCDEVERRYNTRSNRFIVTSVLRSPYSVRRLRNVNANAVDSSTHMFATTFDIAYNKFHYEDSTKAVNGGELKRILAEILLEKRNEGYCWVKYEKKSPCFHITVRK